MLKNVLIPTRGSNMDLEPTNTSVEMDCATGVHVARSGGYKNGSVRGLTRVEKRNSAYAK